MLSSIILTVDVGQCGQSLLIHSAFVRVEGSNRRIVDGSRRGRVVELVLVVIGGNLQTLGDLSLERGGI